MVKGIVNVFDHVGFCLVLNLTTTCTVASGLLYGHQILLPSMLVLLPTFTLVASSETNSSTFELIIFCFSITVPFSSFISMFNLSLYKKHQPHKWQVFQSAVQLKLYFLACCCIFYFSLMALSDTISVYIGLLSPKKREKERRNIA